MFGPFSDQIIGLGATALSPMYVRVFKQYWDNATYSRMKRNYYASSYEQGTLEYYIPTFMDVERNMKYHRIVIATTPQLDKNSLVREAHKHLETRSITPAGIIDSTTIFMVSPRLSRRGFIHSRKLSETCYACPIVTASPELALKRILKILSTFYTRRIKAMVGAFNLESCFSDWRGSFNATLLYITSIIEQIHRDIANGLSCLLHSLNWFKYKLKEIIDQVARQTNIMRVLHVIEPFHALFQELKAKKNTFELNPSNPLLVALASFAKCRSGGG